METGRRVAEALTLELDVDAYDQLLERVMERNPHLTIASTLRAARSATINDWSAVCRTRSRPPHRLRVHTVPAHGVAHGALAMTTPGETSMATVDQVKRLVAWGLGAR